MTTLPYTLTGTVIHGLKKARSLGYPTANLSIDPMPDLPHGVYFGYSTLERGEKNLPSVLFYGTPYAIGGLYPPQFEVHILEKIDLNLYGTKLEVTCKKFLRSNKKFTSHAELQEAIMQDLSDAKKHFLL